MENSKKSAVFALFFCAEKYVLITYGVLHTPVSSFLFMNNSDSPADRNKSETP